MIKRVLAVLLIFPGFVLIPFLLCIDLFIFFAKGQNHRNTMDIYIDLIHNGLIN